MWPKQQVHFLCSDYVLSNTKKEFLIRKIVSSKENKTHSVEKEIKTEYYTNINWFYYSTYFEPITFSVKFFI